MCCCFKSRKQPALAITILSSLVLIAGIVISALAIRFAVGSSFFTIATLTGTPADINVNNFKNVSFGILLGAGLTALATGVFGFFFTCCKKPCYAIIYGVFLSVTWVIIIILGAIVTGVSYGSTGQL